MSSLQPTGLRIAYLVNRYPAASHSFIRREIAAVESAGATVDRWSIRKPQVDIVDPLDTAELIKTRFVLSQSPFSFITSIMSAAFRRPRRFATAAYYAWRMAEPSTSSLFRHAAYLAEASFLVQRFAKDGVDHVHAHFGTNPASVARLIHALGGPTYSFTVHGPDEFDNPKGYALREKIADALVVFAISHFGASQLMRWSATNHWDKIKIARCGVDEIYLDEAHCSRVTSEPKLCCIARLSGQKGLPILIQAAAKARTEVPNLQLNLVGDGELREELEAMIESLGLQANVRILGWQDSESVRRQIVTSRAMVLPSFAEGLPVVIMEAQALMRPVIVTAIAGTPELVDANSGWVVPAGSIDKVAEAMVQALTTDPHVLDKLGAEGRRRVLIAHNANTNGKALYQQILDLKGIVS
jgi:colanic acid/amylovoran biosynthesis glycosyltransferase